MACINFKKLSKPPDNDFEVLSTRRNRCQACADEKTFDDFALPCSKDALVTGDLIARNKGFLRGIPGCSKPVDRLRIQRVARNGAGLFRPNFDEVQVLQFSEVPCNLRHFDSERRSEFLQAVRLK